MRGVTIGEPGRIAPFVVLAIALVAVSHGAIFTRLADAGPFVIAAWRLGIACLVVVPLAIVAPGDGAFSPRAVALAMGAGALLALHFGTWIASLEHTTIARSVLLVSTAPIWVAVMQFAANGRLPSRAAMLALGFATAGALVVGFGSMGGDAALVGDLLAVAGAIAMAGYLLLSRAAQASLPFRGYLGLAYGSAAAWLWLAVGVTGAQATGFDATTWWALAGMALVSQIVGHSGYNWSLRHLDPLYVAVALVGEPVLAACLGWWLLGEAVDWRTGAGGILILAGIAIGARAAHARS
ncbi:MAG: DMT family transporter [Pseudomonadota bacterium]|nr:DMT family transporter [Pseudomonadota bacterium]